MTLLFGVGVVTTKKVIREEPVNDIKGGRLDGVCGAVECGIPKRSRQMDWTPREEEGSSQTEDQCTILCSLKHGHHLLDK